MTFSYFQKELQKNLSEEVFPKYLKNFEKELVANGGTYFVGNSVSASYLSSINFRKK